MKGRERPPLIVEVNFVSISKSKLSPNTWAVGRRWETHTWFSISCGADMASVHGGALSQWAFPLLLVDIVRVDSGSLGGEERHRSFNHCIKIHTLGDKKSKARRQLIDSFQGLMENLCFGGLLELLAFCGFCSPASAFRSVCFLPACLLSIERAVT